MIKRLACLLLLLLVIPLFSLTAVSNETRWFIMNADEGTIYSMAEVRGMDTSLEAGELRSLLLGSEETISEEIEDLSESGDEYALSIIKAGEMNVLEGGLVSLGGDVQVSFALEEGNEISLSADRMLLDPDSGRLSAYGNVAYTSLEEGSAIERIDADIVTWLYNSGDLLVSGGMTGSERQNSEGEPVSLYTSGSLLNYRSADDGMFFTDGYITSNPKTAYSSITADSIALLEGGDMFVTNAYISIGRVPILYLPFFFYPGSRLSFNPSFGFSSSRGMFVSTTTELFGTYPGFAESQNSSFTSLLQTNSDATMVSNGLYYVEGEPGGGLQGWAYNTGSYFALLADVYSESGFLLGFDTEITPWTSKVLSVGSETSFILSTSDASYTDSNFRFYSINSAALSSDFGSISFSLPLYSDPTVLKQYSNRLTSLSIDALFGATQSFPTTRNSSITSYTATLDGSLSLPSRFTNDYVSTLRISSISASADFDWSSSENRYEISDITLPSFNFTMSGTLFSFSNSDIKVEVEEREKLSIAEQFVLHDPLLFDLYVLTPRRNEFFSSDEYYVSLGYTFSERFDNEYEFDSDKWEFYDQELDSTSTLKLELKAKAGQFFSLNQTFTPSYRWQYDEADDEEKTGAFSLLSTTAASIPYIGLTYNLSAYLYRYNTVEDLNGKTTEEIFTSFDTDNIRSHSITLSKSFGDINNYGQITPGLSYTLPPFSAELSASMGYRYRGFTTALSWDFVENDDGKLESEDINFSLGFVGEHITFSHSMLYESDEYEGNFFAPLSFTTSLGFKTADGKFSITEYLDYEVYDGENWNVVNDLRTILSVPFLDFTLNFTTDEDKGFTTEYFELRSRFNNLTFYTWKNRISLSLVMDARLHYDFLNPYSSSFSLTGGLDFSIAEFLSLRLTLTTTNNSFYRYLDDDNNFSFSSMVKDLINSFDFINGGNRNTQFNMQSLDIELIHYMDDWNLHIYYSAGLESVGNNYTWVPTFAIYLSWNTIPDLKVDKAWERRNSYWEQTDSIYSD